MITFLINKKGSNETMKATESKVAHLSVSDGTLRIITDIMSYLEMSETAKESNSTWQDYSYLGHEDHKFERQMN